MRKCVKKMSIMVMAAVLGTTLKVSAASSDTKLVMHMDDAGFTDEMGRQIENSNASLDLYNSAFGRGSVYFNGTSYLKIPNSDDFYFGTGDFTIDYWMKSSQTSGYYPSMIGQDAGRRNGEWALRSMHYWSQNLTFYYYSNGCINVCTGYNINDNKMHHIAFCRHATNLYFFVDGNLIKTAGINAGQVLGVQGSQYPLRAGYNTLDSSGIIGNMDELRITKGSALWTSNFIPPQKPAYETIKTGSINSDTDIYLKSSKNDIALGDEFTVDVNVNSHDGKIKAEDLLFNFDDSRLKFAYAEAGAGVRISKCKKFDNNLQVTAVNKGSEEVNNVKQILRLHFKGQAQGQAFINIYKAEISDLSRNITELSYARLNKVDLNIK